MRKGSLEPGIEMKSIRVFSEKTPHALITIYFSKVSFLSIQGPQHLEDQQLL